MAAIASGFSILFIGKSPWSLPVHWLFHFFVALPLVPDLLFCAKHLFVAAIVPCVCSGSPEPKRPETVGAHHRERAQIFDALPDDAAIRACHPMDRERHKLPSLSQACGLRVGSEEQMFGAK
jgi:hypothetical protein